MRATVYKSTGSWYVVKGDDDVFYKSRIKGKFKIENISSTNPIAVGDIVGVEMENEGEGSVVINEIEARKNYITRVSPHNQHQHHIVASNLDQSLLFATIKEPKTSLGFIDRFLIASEAYQVPSVIVFNKSDLYKTRDQQYFEQVKDIYEKIGYKVQSMSLETGQGVQEVIDLLLDKVTLLSGHSGVGKSTFINSVFPELELKTQDVSGWSGKGLHTTTFAEMFDLPQGGKIIDTPGIRELGLVDIPKQELSHYFREMQPLISDCKFNNCMHINEQSCAVKLAVEEGRIHELRYYSYMNILETIIEKKY